MSLLSKYAIKEISRYGSEVKIELVDGENPKYIEFKTQEEAIQWMADAKIVIHFVEIPEQTKPEGLSKQFADAMKQRQPEGLSKQFADAETLHNEKKETERKAKMKAAAAP